MRRLIARFLGIRPLSRTDARRMIDPYFDAIWDAAASYTKHEAIPEATLLALLKGRERFTRSLIRGFQP